jgi:hypothetical protein
MHCIYFLKILLIVFYWMYIFQQYLQDRLGKEELLFKKNKKKLCLRLL